MGRLTEAPAVPPPVDGGEDAFDPDDQHIMLDKLPDARLIVYEGPGWT